MSTVRLSQSFTIHPVGQGLFYSGSINYQGRVTFRMVFDCGSKTAGAGQEEVTLYRDPDFLAQKKLDLLVISHFDSDHVNHLHRLLEGDVKIKRLVMPFITFEERLFLVLDLLRENGGYRGDGDDFTARLILDPLTTLASNLDDDFEGYIIQSDPDQPITDGDGPDFNGRLEEKEERIIFAFPQYAQEPVESSIDLQIPPEVQGRIKAVKDSTAGHAGAQAMRVYLMDFLFYRKSFGDKETLFYEEVKAAFLKWKKIERTLPADQLTAAVYESIKTIASATEIKKIFKAAAKKAGLKPSKGSDITNPNSTALCLLHRNLDLLNYAAGGRFDHNTHYEHVYPDVTHIQKFLADKSSRLRTSSGEVFDRYYWHSGRGWIGEARFPNTMLTSDSFLLTEADVHAFLKKYQRYYPKFWLMQLPHHGSQENSNAILHAHLPAGRKSFINYGTQNTHKHPSDSVILSLVTCGLSNGLVPVNEYQGFEFALHLNIESRR